MTVATARAVVTDPPRADSEEPAPHGYPSARGALVATALAVLVAHIASVTPLAHGSFGQLLLRLDVGGPVLFALIGYSIASAARPATAALRIAALGAVALWTGLAVALIVDHHDVSAGYLAVQALFLHPFFNRAPAAFASAWVLAALVPIALLVAVDAARTPRRTLGCVLVGVGLAWRAGVVVTGTIRPLGPITWFPAQMAAVGIGVLVTAIDVRMLSRSAARVAAVAAAVTGYLALAALDLPAGGLRLDRVQTAARTVLELIVATGVVVALRTRRARPQRDRGFMILGATLAVFATYESIAALIVRQYPERLVDTVLGTAYRGTAVPVLMWTVVVTGAIAVAFATVVAPVAAWLVGPRADRAPARLPSFGLALTATTAGAVLVRVVALLTVAPIRTDGGDPLYYHTEANILAAGRGFIEPLNWIAHAQTMPTALHGPLYPLYLSVFSRLGGTTYFDQKMASILIGSAVVVVAALIGRRIGGNAVGLVAAVLVAVYPNLWVIDVVMFPEGLFVLCCGLAILAAYRWRDNQHVLDAIALGGLIGLAALTRGEGIFLAVLLALPWIALTRTASRGKRVKALAWVGLGLAVTVGPWMVRNLLSFNDFVPLSTNGNELQVYANNPITYSGKWLGYWYFPYQEQLRAEFGEPPGDESQKSIYWRNKGFDYTRHHLGELPKVVAARIGRQWELFRPMQNIDFAAIENRPRGPSESGLAMYYGLVAFSGLGVLECRRRRQALYPIGIQFVAVTITAAYAYGTIRFRAPAELALCVLAAAGIAPLTRRVVERVRRGTPRPSRLAHWSTRRKTTAALVLVLAGLALPVWGAIRNQGPPMEEGFMLVFPARVLAGAVPNRDFLHLYGPGSLWVLAAVYKVFGTNIYVERMFGWLQQAGIVFGVYALARPFGRRLAIVGAAISTVVIVPAIGLVALAWVGGVALGLWSVVAALKGRGRDDERSARRWFFAAGLIAGAALLYRLDLVVAMTLGLGAAAWGVDRARRRALIAGSAAGVSPYLVHIAMAGPGHVFKGMVVDPVVYLRGGRRLPIPPSWHHFDGWLQQLGNLWTIHWRLPSPTGPAQLTIWFLLLPPVVAAMIWTGRREIRRADSPAARALFATGLFSAGLLPQAIQRADSAHLAWVGCVPFGFLPVLAFVWLRGRGVLALTHRQILASGVALAVPLFLLPHFTVRNYADLVEQTFGRHRLSYPIRHDGRLFYYGRPDVAAVMPQLLDDADRLSKPGDRLFVGTGDLTKTPYSEAFIYYLLPKLTPSTYYIEMDPGVANASDSRMPSDLESSDIVVLSTLFDNWDEPNDSRKAGSSASTAILHKDFCLYRSYGQTPATGVPLYELYTRCSAAPTGAP